VYDKPFALFDHYRGEVAIFSRGQAVVLTTQEFLEFSNQYDRSVEKVRPSEKD
jgi:hypothetical protein